MPAARLPTRLRENFTHAANRRKLIPEIPDETASFHGMDIFFAHQVSPPRVSGIPSARRIMDRQSTEDVKEAWFWNYLSGSHCARSQPCNVLRQK